MNHNAARSAVEIGMDEHSEHFATQAGNRVHFGAEPIPGKVGYRPYYVEPSARANVYPDQDARAGFDEYLPALARYDVRL